MTLPFVSIIIPAKNEEKYIRKCLGSLKELDYPGDCYEVIVVDNGSVDNTENIVRSFGFTVFRRPDLTIAGLRNFGAEMAIGDVLAFVDADVVVSPEWLRNGVAALMEDKVGCAGCSPEIPDESTWVQRVWSLQSRSKPEKFEREWIATMNLLVWKKCFDEIQGFNVSLRTCEDVDFGYRLRSYYRIVNDKTIRAVHYGEAETLFQLFKKESWRGISNFDGIRNHGIVLTEIPSHAVAIYYFAIITSLPLILLQLRDTPLYIMATSLLVFPSYKALLISIRLNRFRYFFKLLVVWLVYCFARGWSVWKSITVSHDRARDTGSVA